MSEQTIPVVNLDDFQSTDADKHTEFVKTLGDALMDLGFFAVTNHGIDSALIERCYQHAQDFFSKPDNVITY